MEAAKWGNAAVEGISGLYMALITEREGTKLNKFRR